MSITTKEIKIPGPDGGAFSAYVAMPENAEKNSYPAMVVIQEIFGVNADMRAKCHDLAANGYVAICPDLFWRIEPDVQLVDSDEAQLNRAFELYGLFNEETGLSDLQTTLGYIRNSKECNGKAGAVGYCLGGKLAFMMACHTDVDAVVSYYGVAIDTLLDQCGGIQSPAVLHIAENDEFVDHAAQNKIVIEFENNDHVTTYIYDGADHAFARINGMHYKHDAATVANDRTDAFFKTHLQ